MHEHYNEGKNKCMCVWTSNNTFIHLANYFIQEKQSTKQDTLILLVNDSWCVQTIAVDD